jgi:hypothetical protein
LIRQIISGGQTGADRAALDFALAHLMPHGGWCPRGRWAEDGTINPQYHLRETPSSEPDQRTEWNVRDSDGTAIFSLRPLLRGGTGKTAAFCAKYAKPSLHLCGDEAGPGLASRLAGFLHEHQIGVLNVAGARESEEPGIAAFTRAVLEAMWSLLHARHQY